MQLLAPASLGPREAETAAAEVGGVEVAAVATTAVTEGSATGRTTALVDLLRLDGGMKSQWILTTTAITTAMPPSTPLDWPPRTATTRILIHGVSRSLSMRPRPTRISSLRLADESPC